MQTDRTTKIEVQTDRQRFRQTDRDRTTETDRDKTTKTDRQRYRQSEREREREAKKGMFTYQDQSLKPLTLQDHLMTVWPK